MSDLEDFGRQEDQQRAAKRIEGLLVEVKRINRLWCDAEERSKDHLGMYQEEHAKHLAWADLGAGLIKTVARVARIQTEFADDLAYRDGNIYEQVKDLVEQFHAERAERLEPPPAGTERTPILEVKDIVRDFLKREGFDGLCADDGECACNVDDLAPCGEMQGDCAAGMLAPCDCGEHDWHIQIGRVAFAPRREEA